MNDPGIDLWWFRLDPPEDCAGDRAIALLGPAERARLRQFTKPRAAGLFALRRAIRRVILARYLGAEPGALGFEEPEGAKPRLIAPRADLEFSASDAPGIGVIAVAQGTPVGADVEVPRPVDTAALARRILSPAERIAHRQAADDAERHRMLFQAWTAKEAVLKGIGAGLDLALMGRIAVVPMPRPGAWQEIGVAGGPETLRGWQVQAVDLAADGAGGAALVTLASPTPRPVRVVAARDLLARHGLA